MQSEVDGILVVAHELKAPLTVLRQLALSLGGNSEAEQVKAEMVEVSERALRQVNDFAKIRNLKNGLFQMEPVAVRAVCDEVTQEISRLFSAGTASFSGQVAERFSGRVSGRVAERRKFLVRYANRSRLAFANRELLSSVIYNFLVNALNYSSEETRVVMDVLERRGNIRIEVRDFGPALPGDVWKEIRKGFIAEPTSIAMRPGSSGIGLYIASKFARYMSAEVGAVRHRDGTSFYIELPISKQMSFFEAGV